MSSVVGDIGVSIGISEEDLNRGVARVAKSLNDLGKVAERMGAQIDAVIDKMADKTGEATQATRKLTEEQEKAARAAEQHKKALSDTRQGLTQISVAATAASVALLAMAKSSTDAFKQEQAAFAGLETVATRTIGSFGAAKDAANAFADDGLANVMNYSKAIQDYLTAGFNLDEAKELIQISRDAAAFNRQAGLSFGEAIERMAQGVKQGNSVVSDAAGITKNLSQILKEQGYSEQDLQRVQSDAAVRQALLNGLRQEGAIFAGNASKASETLAGSEAKASNAAFQAKAAFGEALAPAMQNLYDAMTPLIQSMSAMVKDNPELARSLFLVVGGATALTAAVGALTVAFMALNLSLGPIGWALVGISAAAGAIGGMALSAKAAAQAEDQHAASVVHLKQEYDRLQSVLDSTTASSQDKERAQSDLKRIISELGDLMPEVVSKWDSEGQAIELNTEKLEKNTTAVRDNLLAKRQQAAMAAADDEAAARDALEKFLTDKENSRRSYIANEMHFAGPEITLNSEKRAAFEQKLNEEFDAKFAADERDLRQALAKAEAETNRLSALAAGPDERGRGSYRSTLSAAAGGTTNPPPTTQPDPFKAALRYIDHQKALDQLPLVQEIAMLEEVKSRYAITADQIMEIDERLHAARKTLGEKEAQDTEKQRKAKLDGALRLLDHQLAMGQIGTADEIKRLHEILDTYDVTADERMALDERLQRAQDQFGKQVVQDIKDRERADLDSVQKRVQNELDTIDHMAAMGQLSKQQQIDALEAHLKREEGYYKAHADERRRIEEQVYGLKEELRQTDAAAQKKADQDAANARAKLIAQERTWLQQLATEDLNNLRQRHQAAEAAQQARIKGLQAELSALERKWAAEDRRNGLTDLREQLAAVKADTRYLKIGPDGQAVYTYDEERAREIEQQIADAERDAAREAQRQALQDQINAAQASLDAMRTAHQQEETERQRFWTAIQEADLTGYADLTKAAENGMGEWVKVLSTHLSGMQTEAETRAAAIRTALASITAAISGASIPAIPQITAPTLPTNFLDSIDWRLKGVMPGGGGVTVELGGVTVNVPNVNSNAELQAALPSAMQQAGYDLAQMVRDGRIQLRTR